MASKRHGLCEQVNNSITGWDMNKTKNFIMNQFADVMTINLYVFGMFMMDRISGNANSTCIITKR